MTRCEHIKKNGDQCKRTTSKGKLCYQHKIDNNNFNYDNTVIIGKNINLPGPKSCYIIGSSYHPYEMALVRREYLDNLIINKSQICTNTKEFYKNKINDLERKLQESKNKYKRLSNNYSQTTNIISEWKNKHKNIIKVNDKLLHEIKSHRYNNDILYKYELLKSYMAIKNGKYINNNELGDISVNDFYKRFYDIKRERNQIAHPTIENVDLNSIRDIMDI